jgi:hypothetical protein
MISCRSDAISERALGTGAFVIRLATILAIAPFIALAAHAQSNRLLVYKYPMVPPDEYIRPFEGQITITRLPTMQGVREACPTARPATSGLLACAAPWRAVPESALRCDIYIVSDDVLKAKKLTYELIHNHELAHCNGWPWAPEDRGTGEIFREVQPEDPLKHGLIPEFVGRLPVVATLEDLD